MAEWDLLFTERFLDIYKALKLLQFLLFLGVTDLSIC